MTVPPVSQHKFDHLVLLMMENRSFDHLMGFLYEGDQPAVFIPDRERVFRGVAGGPELWNPDAHDPPRRVIATRAPYQTLNDMTRPFPDPGEEFENIMCQMFGVDKLPRELSELPDIAPMNGFVRDYLRHAGSRPGLAEEIMRCFPPQATPVLSGLARAFAVSDAWFASVPSQTYCNRSFVHAATSSGFVHNANYIKWVRNTAPTLFERLLAILPPRQACRVYWDPQDLIPVTRLIHRPLYTDQLDEIFVDMAAFEADCAAGDLPAYTFIQPRIIVNNNDMHPAFFASQTADSSILAGEELIARVYDALRSGPRWERTLFVILFDEGGGTFDHYPPPARATPPTAAPDQELEAGFQFDRFGVRVPAVFISPYIIPGTVIRADGPTPFDHTSIIKTLTSRWGLPSLTDRDRAAPDFSAVLARPLAEPRLLTPTFTPRPHLPAPLSQERRSPLSGLKKAILTHAIHERGLFGLDLTSVGKALELLT
jgi:phospholipase C